MRVLGQVPCPSDVSAGACVKVRIENRGQRGDGSCQLWGTNVSETGNTGTAGMKVMLTDFESGATVTKILPWDHDVPKNDFYFKGLCDPGLKS